MRRLRDFQIVGLDLPGVDATCRVVAVDGGQVVLEPHTPAQVAELGLPATATLSFDTEHHPILLSGTADAGPIPGTLAFWVTDHVGVRPARLRPRLKADLAVRVTPVDATGRRVAFAQDYATTDVSAGGLAIVGLDVAPGAPLGVELAVPGLLEPVSCRARAVRRRADGTTAVAFVDLDPVVAQTLDRLIFAVRQRVARQAFRLRDAA
ncbi:MAG TPA: PilZ domain-containing protein [Baekduia sp.]|nr:PilZ domain-containing protein [Baekduia sp.]